MDAKRRSYPVRLIGSLVLPLAATTAQAQTPSPMPEWYYSQGQLLQRYVRGELPQWQRTIGLAVETQPKYEGANAYRTFGGPAFDIRYRDLAFASTGEGLGINLVRGRRCRAGIALAYDLGRDEDVDHHLTGLHDNSPSPEAKLFVEYLVVFPLTLRIDARHSFGGQGGWIGDLSLYAPLAGSEKFFVFAGPSLTFADSDNLRHTFGVSVGQSMSSGYPPYDAGSGLRSGSFGVSGGYYLTRRWLVESAVGAEKLFRGAGNSPYVQEKGQVAVTLSTEYRW